jgi:hypothetical protein
VVDTPCQNERGGEITKALEDRRANVIPMGKKEII